MKSIIFIFLSAAFLFSCNNHESCDKDSAVKEVVNNEDVVADSETVLAVEGMMCEMGCVSAIQKELKSTPGVANAVVNFENEIATISFDSKQVNEEDLIAAIEGIGDHAYKATKVEASSENLDEQVEEVIEVIEATQAH